MVAKLMTAIPLFVLTLSACGTLDSPPTPRQQSEADVKNLLLLMDKDFDGKVSRDEFMSFMNSEFDRLDTKKNGELDESELSHLRVVAAPPAAAAK